MKAHHKSASHSLFVFINNVNNAIENQKNFLSTHCSIVYGVGADGEGNFYNAIVPNN